MPVTALVAEVEIQICCGELAAVRRRLKAYVSPTVSISGTLAA